MTLSHTDPAKLQEDVAPVTAGEIEDLKAEAQLATRLPTREQIEGIAEAARNAAVVIEHGNGSEKGPTFHWCRACQSGRWEDETDREIHTASCPVLAVEKCVAALLSSGAATTEQRAEQEDDFAAEKRAQRIDNANFQSFMNRVSDAQGDGETYTELETAELIAARDVILQQSETIVSMQGDIDRTASGTATPAPTAGEVKV